MSRWVSSGAAGFGGSISAAASANVGCASMDCQAASDGPFTSSVGSQLPSRRPVKTSAADGTLTALGEPSCRTSHADMQEPLGINYLLSCGASITVAANELM